MRVALFPGQGVQAARMADSLVAEQHDALDEASAATGIDMTALCSTGRARDADLASSRWTQVAIVAVSVGAARVLRRRGEPFDACCGHSLGEYSALVAAGSMALADTLAVIARRAEAMDEAARRSPGGMVAVLGLDRAAAEQLSGRFGVVVSADNAPGQTVLSGSEEALEAAARAAKDAGAKTARLHVAGPFHSEAMAPAAAVVRAALADVPIRAPDVPVWSPTTRRPFADAHDIRRVLVDQMTRPVLWCETIADLASRADAFVDVGPGRVAAGLARRIAPHVPTAAFEEVVRADRV